MGRREQEPEEVHGICKAWHSGQKAKLRWRPPVWERDTWALIFWYENALVTKLEALSCMDTILTTKKLAERLFCGLQMGLSNIAMQNTCKKRMQY